MREYGPQETCYSSPHCTSPHCSQARRKRKSHVTMHRVSMFFPKTLNARDRTAKSQKCTMHRVSTFCPRTLAVQPFLSFLSLIFFFPPLPFQKICWFSHLLLPVDNGNLPPEGYCDNVRGRKDALSLSSDTAKEAYITMCPLPLPCQRTHTDLRQIFDAACLFWHADRGLNHDGATSKASRDQHIWVQHFRTRQTDHLHFMIVSNNPPPRLL